MSKFFKVTAKGNDAAEIELFGDVCEQRPEDWWTGEKIDGDFIVLDEFREAIKGLEGAKEIIIKLNSFGGDLFAGKAIHDELKALKANKTVKIMGVAMSAATVIMLAGDKITANAGDIIMIHEAKVAAWDNFDAEAAQRLVNLLSTCNKAMAELYAKKTGKGVQEILNAMHAETWLTAQQALDYGLIDEVIDSGADQVKLVASMDRKKLYAAGRELNLRGMSLPESITKLLPTEAAPTPGTTAPSAPSAKSGKNTLKEEGEKMEPKTVAELEAAHPDLVKAIREQAAAEAKAKERARIEEIEKIESSLCMSREEIHAAKYGETPADARDLAFISAQQQAKVSADKLAAMKADAENSGANKVAAAGNDGSANTNTERTQAQAEVQAMLEKFAGKFN